MAGNDSGLPKSLSGSPGKDDSKYRRNWIRYRTEVCSRHTGEVLRCVDTEEPPTGELQRTDNDPIFEHVTRYKARDVDGAPKENEAKTYVPSQAVTSAPSYSLRIYSPAIINGLQSVVRYYPDQDLSGSVVVIKWPYPILVHHYAELRNFKTMCETTEPKELCMRERDAPEHIGHLLRFLDDNIMARVRAEEERVNKGYYTFENLWVAYRPGRTIVEMDSHDIWNPYVVSTISGGIFQNPPVNWTMHGWRLIFDGRELGRTQFTMDFARFDGERKWQDDTRFVDDQDVIKDDIKYDILEKLILDGERYWKLEWKQ